jgi:hypothetical protein
MGRLRLAAVAILAAASAAPVATASAWTPPLTLAGADGAADVAVDADGVATIATGGTLPRLAGRAPSGFFGDPVPVAPLAPGPPAGADVAAAGHGALAFAWQDGFGRIMAAVRDPGGLVGAPQRLSPAHGRGVTGPAVAVDAAGTALATWLGALDRGGRGLVYAAYRPAGGVFGAPRRLTVTPATYPPALAMNAGGRAVATWRRDGRAEMVSVEDGAFGRVRVVGGPRVSGRPSVAVTGDGGAVVAWTEGRRIVAAWRGRHGRFREPRVLRAARPRWTAGAPAVAAGPRGETVVAWTETHGPLAQVVAVRGRRGTPRPVRPLGPHRPGVPAVAIRAGGRVTVAWTQRRGGAQTPDVLLSTALPGTGFGTPRHVDLAGPAAAPVPALTPAIAAGGTSTVLTWTIASDGTVPARVRWSAEG